ncbi:MAG: 2-oxoglutarate dehydrogenase [Bacteroidetes bacterium GWC2_33_15]|nr:MAG: 2-oxoglutarate dehydrogenase [Bacteroidetes bacterium GWA2_33_15]OFX51064.1 MAG: 2-oxoglutarate dehydrogenase [Bacteroidetes bacterium GWC2_33_15]OFX66503.1 MAG: 2-oxoglutarate dehydrogenase [Bacteroidetes bacterium GWB2_32_14]OFX70272.1 MAG: 2-oxoglutarate dehydrogenase [Bacteroidetes bacterium GWD2_33_33]HAN17269.1 dihydrolipoyllysine-residue succinyltransferase [Bacteroidales bacterium]
MIEIKIPSPGESITEVVLSNWLVENGQYVEKDQEIAEIESDKATLPLIASESGKIEILIAVGTTTKVGAVACKIDTNVKPTESKPQQTKKVEVPKQDVKKENLETQNAEHQLTNSEYSNVKISPVAQKLMEENNLNIDDVIKGLKRIGKHEIEQILAQKSSLGINSNQKTEISRETEHKKISPLRKKLSERLVSVKNETAMLTTFNEVDMTKIIKLRNQYQNQFTEKHGIKLGFMSFFTKAVTIALKAYPAVNSQIADDEILYPDYADIGIAVQTPKGLMVPVVRNAESMSLAELEIKIKELADKGRAGRISLEELSGGTFTITNGGVFGSLLSTPILNPPQSGILGMHNIQERPVAINGKVAIRPMMYVALSYDHRTIDGKDSVGFLVKVKELLESPYKMIAGDKNADEVLLGL